MSAQRKLQPVRKAYISAVHVSTQNISIIVELEIILDIFAFNKYTVKNYGGKISFHK
jgi:hypothetical protein